MAENMIIDDMKNQSGIPDEEFCEGGNAKWCFVTDKVMGGISKGSLDFKKDNSQLFSIIRNQDLYDCLFSKLCKDKLFNLKKKLIITD